MSFTQSEIELLVDSLNGTLLGNIPESAWKNALIGHTEDSITLDRLDKKWNVVSGDLLAKLAELTNAQAKLLMHMVRAWWIGTNSDVDTLSREIAAM